ncbi:hypothetical protein DCAR_0520406 [Daucus carota subsp. sativus]|uniref:Uncharacterized protein n=1 Tax=Daucus carota subsp. sativus TaxID=79200 RepID=A0AAF0W9T1_DAUCS|nr:hypothetical protein DCAR_0103235 [Daucus carota subsp. sativus]WOH01028.1 hypothetical protein DCAR_0520406 [Daucus carota subsp. sativus]
MWSHSTWKWTESKINNKGNCLNNQHGPSLKLYSFKQDFWWSKEQKKCMDHNFLMCIQMQGSESSGTLGGQHWKKRHHKVTSQRQFNLKTEALTSVIQPSLHSIVQPQMKRSDQLRSILH